MFDGPIGGAAKDIRPVIIHAENEAANNHDAEAVKTVCNRFVVPAEVLSLVAAFQIVRCQGLEAYKDAAKPRVRSTLDQVASQNRVHCRRSLKNSFHATHAGKQGLGETPVSQEVIVKKIEVSPGQTVDLGKCVIDALCVEAATALIERILVAEVTMLRTAARNHDGVRHQIVRTFDQIATCGRDALQAAAGC